jgi:hypothetical protein
MKENSISKNNLRYKKKKISKLLKTAINSVVLNPLKTNLTVHPELPYSTVGYSSAVCSADNMDLSQGIYGGFDATLIVTIIVLITMARLAFNYVTATVVQFKHILVKHSHGKRKLDSDEAVEL